MGISYNPSARQWSYTDEKTDYFANNKTDYETNRATNLYTDFPINFPTNLPTNHNSLYSGWKSSGGEGNLGTIKGAATGLYVTYLGRYPSEDEVESWRQTFENKLGWKRGSGFGGEYFKLLESYVKNSDEAENLRVTYFNNEQANRQNAFQNTENVKRNADNAVINQKNQQLNDAAKNLNEKNKRLNDEAFSLNRENTAKNQVYRNTVGVASGTKGGDYVVNRDGIFKQAADTLTGAGVSPEDIKGFNELLGANYKLFYQTEKLERWNPSLGATPPYGTFDPRYYQNQNPVVADAWKKAASIDDIDITERYGENNFYWQHYTNIGKQQGLRGNKEEDTERANQYTEQALTDKELQSIRDLQLGVDVDSIAQRLLNIPEVTNEWTKARQGDAYWTELAKQKYLDPKKAEDFAILFRLSDRPEDRQIILDYNINAGSGITDLEEAINTAISERKEVDAKKFGALNQTILKEAIGAMKQQKAQQEMLSFFRGFSGFTEVVDINQELANSILGDTGVGGILSYTSAGKAQEDLLGALQNVTGMRNSATYNWQQWFDKSIKEKYGIDYSLFEPLENKKDVITAFLKTEQKPFDVKTGKFADTFLQAAGFDNTEKLVEFLNAQGEEGQVILNTIKGDPGETAKSVLTPIQSRIEADIKTLDETGTPNVAASYSIGDKIEMMNIEAQFARNYLDDYLIPRFSTSRSMDEFIDYLDVRQQEQNPFTYGDFNKDLQKIGQLRSDAYLDQIAQEEARFFDPNFYFDPAGDKSRTAKYAQQKATVEQDWEKAKTGDPYWATQAYRFGIDVNNKAAFARMHFEVKGQGQGYDAAEDIVNAGKVQDFISNKVLPELQSNSKNAEVAFSSFITPEEFADEMLQGLDPAKTPDAWKEILQRYGLSDFATTVDEVKQYVVEAVRNGSAQQIREQIKYLNEKRQKPTQEILGITYISRPEDYKETAPKPTTELYSIFQRSGYQGTEDEFYENMFPDLDRSEQALLTQAGKDKQIKTYGLDLTNPFSSLGTIESFFPEYQKEVDEETAKESAKDFYTSYFKIGEEEEPVKSKSGQAFLGEFTSMFKGL